MNYLKFESAAAIVCFLIIIPSSIAAKCFVGVHCTREQANAAIEAKLGDLPNCGYCTQRPYRNYESGCIPRDSWTVSRYAKEDRLRQHVPCFEQDGLSYIEYNIVERYSVDWNSAVYAYYVRLPEDQQISCHCAYLRAKEQKDSDSELGGTSDNEGPCPSKIINPHKGNPVNIINGNKYEVITDLSISTPFQAGLNFVRHYNSQADLDGPIGFGWSHSYQVSLNPNHGVDRIKIKKSDGRGIYFLFDSASMDYKGTLGEKTYVETDGLTYTWKRDNSVDYLFDSEGVLQEIHDAFGNKQVLTYDSEGRLETIVDQASGRILQLTYTPDGKIDHISGPVTTSVSDGILARYSYDNLNLSSVQYSDNTGFSYTYDDPNDPHNVTLKEDKGGNFIASWTYDDQDRVTFTEARDAENLTIDFIDENTTITTDSYGIERTYHFAEKGGIRRILPLTVLLDARHAERM